MGKLEGKVALITGGISGIGAYSAELFADEGARLVLVDLDEEKGQSFAKKLTDKGHDVIFLSADVTDQQRAEEVFNTAVEKYGQIDILFNNAGIGAPAPSHEIDYADYRKVVEIDLDAVFLYSQFGLRQVLEQNGGVIINTASMYG